MKRVITVVIVAMLVVATRLIFAAGSVPVGKAEDVGLSTERLKRVSEAVDRHIAAGNVAGAVSLVARRGKIAHFDAQGVMDVDTKKPMAKDKLFRLASMSKPITGADLLKHGSGLVSGGLGSAAAPRLAPRTPTDTLATYIPKLAAVPLDFQPGTLWRYSGQAGFEVLGRVIEIVSGQTFDQFLKQRIFDPLGMKDT